MTTDDAIITTFTALLDALRAQRKALDDSLQVSEFNMTTAREWLAKNPKTTSVNVNAYVAALDEITRLSAPRAMLLWCPQCNARHIDEGEFADKPHHTHACQGCGHVWRPGIEPTSGVRFLPGFRNKGSNEVVTIEGFCPFSVPFGKGTQKCACHGIGTRERAAK